MLYIDPRDHEIQTADPVLYKAWMDRKALRLKHCETLAEVAKLDAFIEMYISRSSATFHLKSQTITIDGLQQGKKDV